MQYYSGLLIIVNFVSTENKNQGIKILKTPTILTAEQKKDYMKYMKVDYMSSHHSIPESALSSLVLHCLNENPLLSFNSWS